MIKLRTLALSRCSASRTTERIENVYAVKGFSLSVTTTLSFASTIAAMTYRKRFWAALRQCLPT